MDRRGVDPGRSDSIAPVGPGNRRPPARSGTRSSRSGARQGLRHRVWTGGAGGSRRRPGKYYGHTGCPGSR